MKASESTGDALTLHPKPADDTIDELANTLLEDTPQDLGMRVSAPGEASPLDLPWSTSSIVVVKDSDQHVPPIPNLGLARGEGGQPRALCSDVLAPKTTNLKVPAKKSRKLSKVNICQPAKHSQISAPTDLQAVSSPSEIRSSHASHQTPTSNRIFTTSDSANMSRKLSVLMQQTGLDDNSAMSTFKTDNVASGSTQERKPSPLQKGKEAIARAKRVFSDHLGSSGEKKQKERKSGSSALSSSSDELAAPGHTMDAEISRRRLDRRIAEGENLGKLKIGFLTGDGNIPRKALPVYESMKSTRHRSESPDDPFSDDMRSQEGLLAPNFSKFDFDFDGCKGKRASVKEPLSSPQQMKTSPGTIKSTLQPVSRPLSRFSGFISGLAQHSDTEFFSSSPVGFSTPRIRLEPHFDASGRKRLSTVLAKSPSVLDYSLEEPSDNEIAHIQHAEQIGFSPCLSLKRKTAKANLRSASSPAMKRAKKGPRSSEEMSLTSGIGKLTTNDSGSGTVSSDQKRTRRAATSNLKAKGLKIFKISKGKEPMRRGSEFDKQTKGRTLVGRRYSTSKPTKRYMNREHRASMPILGSVLQEGSMGADELQMDEHM